MLKHVLFILLVAGCTNQKNPVEVRLLKGYWEIDKVIAPNGDEKHYTFNQTIDYFEFTDSLNGYRKKLQPTFDGGFVTSKDIERFSVEIENDSTKLFYKNAWSSWKETLIKAEKEQLILVNESGIQYVYRPYEKIQLTDE